MTSTQIRQSFLDFFKSKQHTIVPSSSLMPDSPNLLFTNAGMNQFVPIFLGQTQCPYSPGRAADTQKCIRAGGKHNDLDDVGLDTYHHTFFEMLGNWSFGDYFKKEAISWAWELVVEIWKFPPTRVYATVYSPDKSKNDPSEFDQEAWNYWAGKFRSAGLDPAIHIVNGNKKDNFWMMGDTGPCGPCSELHIDLTPDGDTKGSLVNKGDARCIEIWNLVFIQFNANPDGTFSPLPAQHVDTGMGFERVTSIIQGTKNLQDFANAKISNYETDIFRPIFDKLEELSGRKYTSTLPLAHPNVNASAPLSRGEHAPSRVPDRALAVGTDARHRASSPVTTDTKYSRRNLPHFERPWAKYMVTFSTRERRKLTSPERDLVLKSILYAHEHRQYELYAACVMPDHVHLLFEPQIKETGKDGHPVFWSLSDILQGIKSASAHNINKTFNQTGHVWEQESMDRMVRGQSDMEEKFHYICRNPWDTGVAEMAEDYPWLWTPGPLKARTDVRGEHAPSRVPDRAPAVGTDARHRASSPVTTDAQHSEPRAEAHVGAVDEASTAAREARALPEDAPLKTSGEGPSNIIEVPSHEHPAEPTCAEVKAKMGTPEQIQIDIAFRVIADHIRTLSFAIADGIQPGNNDRNYVLRRILRRAVRYGRTLGFHEPFFYKLVDVLADTMGDVFPEIRTRKKQVQETIRIEEEAFNKTLDTGIGYLTTILNLKSRMLEIQSSEAFRHLSSNIEQFRAAHVETADEVNVSWFVNSFNWISLQYTYDSLLQHLNDYKLTEETKVAEGVRTELAAFGDFWHPRMKAGVPKKDFIAHLERVLKAVQNTPPGLRNLAGSTAFTLYDTYGFPLDLTELMARERGLTVDKEGFKKLMEEQRTRARAAQKKEVISLSQIETTTPTKFIGYENLATEAKVLEVVSLKDKTAVVLDTSACYAEMGGQVGDTGELTGHGQLWRITNTQKSGDTWLHFVGEEAANVGQASRLPSERFSASSQTTPASAAHASETPALPLPGASITLSVDRARRHAIERHHTVTHLLHWALHEVASKEASQKGSFVGPDKLTFDFNSAPLTPQQIADIEKLVNERIVENAPVSWTEVKHKHVKDRKDVMQFFGDKYGEWVRVVQIGGQPTALDGYSMELCGGTHTRATGEIGLFRIVGENAIAAGVRRIEAVAGLEAYNLANSQLQLIRTIAGKINSPVHELEKKVDLLLAHQKELEKSLKAAQQREAAGSAKDLVARAETINGTPTIIANLGANDGDTLQAVADALKSQFKGVVVVGGSVNGAVTLIASVSPEFTSKVQAGKIIQQIAPIVGGKGGGKPDNARGGGKDASKLDEALAKVKSLLG